MKALGVGLGAFPFVDVEVVRLGLDPPRLVLAGSALALARRAGVTRWHLSLTHTDRVAMAFVVAEGPGIDGASTGCGPPPEAVASGPMQPVLTVAEMNAVDAAAQATIPLEVLVGRAGHAVARVALDMLGGAYGRRVTVIAGRGNNGADGRVAARYLAGRGVRVTVVEAATEPDPTAPIGPADLVIDAAYGTGFHGRYRSPAVDPGTPVLAVDIPSGVAGDTGSASGTPLAARRTVTFVALKPGLVQGDGVGLAGRVTVVDIGLPPGESGHLGRWTTVTWPPCSPPAAATATNGRPPCWWWPARPA